ncbi:Cobalt-zinc-cadmium resistance protein CzcC precursor [Bremerella volcania]|uniref:Cobalt-zinc-cadmium resistance protein CzcC n=1 Tax=Bremerella volcania TaxID=2527984 RepID=A0A518C5N8_9BACT|nr:TolC family protein [Bremerella volcania]QDU74543.1 Cobalt-zinc-cadmium resistance protein CzcC precursor [Bremerella volcania]
MAVRSTLFLLGAIALLAGCKTAHQVRDPEYAHVAHSVHQAWHASTPVADAVDPVFSHLEGPHPVEEYLQFALNQNPDIQAARKQMEAIAHQVPVAASLEDPKLGMTFYPEQVQTAAGQQEFALTANQKFPWHGKLDARAQLVESQTNMARAQLAAVELATIAKVKRSYYELYFIQQAIAVTEADRKLLGEIRDVANARYKAGKASQQDLLRAELEISNVENELIRLRQRLKSAQARLARVMHIAPQTKVRALDRVPPEQVPRDLEWLQRQAVAARPELHAQLAALERDQRAVELARLDYMPDVTLGATWIDVASAGISPVANGRDSFLLTAGINLPIYRKRLDSSVRSAEAKAVSTARPYDSLRDATLEEVMDLFAQAQSQQDLLTLFREDILPKARQTLEVSSRAYNTGEVDFLQLIDNWRQLLRYEISYRRLEASLRQTLAELERVVGGFTGPSAETIPTPREEPQALPPPP